MNKAILGNRVSYAHALSHVKRVRCREKKIDFVDFNLPVTVTSNQNTGFMISKWQFWETKQPRQQIMLVVLFFCKIDNNHYARILKTLP